MLASQCLTVRTQRTLTYIEFNLLVKQNMQLSRLVLKWQNPLPEEGIEMKIILSKDNFTNKYFTLVSLQFRLLLVLAMYSIQGGIKHDIIF